jgi:serine/threonine protein kinase
MDTKQRFRARNGKIEIIGGPSLEIPLICAEEPPLSIRDHAEVFQGTDAQKRKISIKVWKYYTPEAFARTRNELAKLAAIKDQRSFVDVYQFDALADPVQPGKHIPYTISEYVDGVPANKWLGNNGDQIVRCALWQLIRAGLSTLYKEGITHGDPHLGNTIVVGNGPKHSWRHCSAKSRAMASRSSPAGKRASLLAKLMSGGGT